VERETGSGHPPLRSLDSPDLLHNLPSQASSFVGREQELEQLRTLLDESRVLTLTGAGGVGETRPALQLAADLLDGSSDGVWFVDLAPLSDPGLVAAKAARALGVREEPGRSVRESLVLALKPRRLLAVVDNCEHVIGEAATLVDELVRVARSSRSCRPAASRSVSRVNTCTACHRLRSRRAMKTIPACSSGQRRCGCSSSARASSSPGSCSTMQIRPPSDGCVVA
jgi:hypothetical protein